MKWNGGTQAIAPKSCRRSSENLPEPMARPTRRCSNCCLGSCVNFFWRIPKRFRNKAQGCEERATLGSCVQSMTTLKAERVAAHGNGGATRPQPRWGCETPATFTQGSSSLATLGFVAKSLWDFPQECLPGSWHHAPPFSGQLSLPELLLTMKILVC